jgi:hypothetical protein
MNVRLNTRVFWIAMAALSVAANAAPARYPISAGQIADAFTQIGMSVTAEQITLPAEVVATTATPDLKIRSVQPMADHSTVVRLECGSRAECVPFFVKLTLGMNGDEAVGADRNGRPLPIRLELQPSRKEILVRAGSTAVLLLDGEHIHIQIPVTCLANGGLGDKIRARENGRVFTGEVVDTGVLKANL